MILWCWCNLHRRDRCEPGADTQMTNQKGNTRLYLSKKSGEITNNDIPKKKSSTSTVASSQM